MDRTERLLDLVALLLDAKGPLSFAQLREAFPQDYAGSDDAAERKFERDKAELLELGIPLTFVPPLDEAPGGYALDKGAYYLPEAGLSPEELALLYAAGSAALASGAFPGQQDLAHALRKVAFLAEGPLASPRVRLELGTLADTRELPARLELLWGAIGQRKSVDLEYASPRAATPTRRRVDPWGLALRRGVWTLVGYCHLRQGVRAFHVHRVRTLALNPLRPRSADFEVPADFRLDDHVAAWPWQHRLHAPLEVVVRLSGDLAALAPRVLPGPAREAPDGVRVTVRATFLDGLVSYLLSLGPGAVVEAPPEAVERLRAAARRVLLAHGGVA
jgi:proteasome accessory factor B